MQLMQEIEKGRLRQDIPEFSPGDTVDVHVRIIEGQKERIQVFNGTVIARTAGGLGESFTVRRIVDGEGVERVFPLHSPRVAKIVLKKRGMARRAKLFYLRERTGKGTRVKEAQGKIEVAEAGNEQTAKPAGKKG